ncbi:ArsR/SmtB family transcription factor [Halomonas halocynthiae]|uniref:ArsR/SmtB family transcription factor n=1 Tax=Halomonas halocynthiae TaxID=176290 RepID=UPI000A0398DF|nr:helix-turn-helix transcriptional regulator [Halomonas halocynthiae]
MKTFDVIASFSALAQETRLDAFRLLVRQEPCGLPAGEIARQLSVPHATMSAHLSVLSRAGLVTSRRQGRSIIYRANLTHMQEAISFLVRDCCAGHPEVCDPLAKCLSDCSANQSSSNQSSSNQRSSNQCSSNQCSSNPCSSSKVPE